ncbi:MAG: glutamate--tRNA ligase, partial [Synergistaceae bacterium]|nr:glutamate--tRNA ligase [Synergistaceae bacterium]
DYYASFEPVKARYDASDITEEQMVNLKAFCNEILSSAEWKHEALEETARIWVERNNIKMKECAMPLRFALTGMKVSPGIFEVAVLLGREETKRRLEFYKFI